MPKTTVFSGDLLKLIFQGIGIANLADNTATDPLTDLYVSLHTAAPGIGGSQTTNEVAYTIYARVAVPRSPGNWVVSSNGVTPVYPITFPIFSAGADVFAPFWAVGTVVSGAGKVLYYGTISPALNLTVGITPQLGENTQITES